MMKMGKSDIFGFEIGPGFGEPGGTPPLRIPRSTLEKDKINLVSLTITDCFSLRFQGYTFI